ncbi:MAG: DUF2442 domain-containing protein [Gallionella sp.]|nr:DUF2442 domain-containing protein [Gallionella sp.]
MLLKIDHAEYLGNYHFRFLFNNGRVGEADIRPLLDDAPRSVFAPLADESFVSRFMLTHGTLCWPNELDVAPEYFYFLAFRDDPGLYDQFVSWGYLQEKAVA